MRLLTDLWTDLRYALRTLRKAPGFTAVAVLSLALGIGANASAFSIVSSMLLRPLPADEPGRLVALFGTQKGAPPSTISYPDYLAYRGLSAFQDLAAHQGTQVSLSTGGRAEIAWGELVTSNYFTTLRVDPALGRTLLPGDGDPRGSSPVVVLSHALWQRRFGGDPAAVGRSLRLNGRAFTVVGVAPEGFLGTRLFAFAPEVYVPLGAHAVLRPERGVAFESRGSRWLHVVGRLRPGATLKGARAQAAALAGSLAREHPENEGLSIRVESNRAPINPWVLEPATLRRMAALLMLAMGFVLLIACTNVANLLLARAASRRREIAIRLSIGSGRARLVRQLLTESLVLAALGGAVGLLLAVWLVDASQALQPELDFSTAFDLRVDGRVLAFTAASALITALLFGLVPALQATRSDVGPVLKDEAGGRTAARSRLREGLVVVQLALSLVLLIGAGLFVRSFRAAQEIDPGFEPEGALRVSMDLDLAGYDEERKTAFRHRLLDGVEALPGVRSAGFGHPLPLDAYASGTDVHPEGWERGRDEEQPWVFHSLVGAGYFETMRTPLVSGRGLEERDRADAPAVAVVNETFARRFWPGQEPQGRRFSIEGPGGAWIEIVGVARDGKYMTLGESPRPYLFLPVEQHPSPRTSLIVRTDGDPEALMPDLRRFVRRLDPDLPLFGAKTLSQQMETPLSAAESGAATVGTFGALALLLAASGIYGVISYAVAQRTREIGIRVALGARPADVLRLVLGRGARLVGIAIGAVGALALGRALTGLLYGISGADPATYATVSLLLGAVALVASGVPARRAARLDPLAALRHE